MPSPADVVNPAPLRRRILLLQAFTLAWMLAECAVALWAAARAHSPVLLAFGLDSVIELLSAALVVFALAPRLGLSRKRIDFAAGLLLFALAAAVAASSGLALAGKLRPEASAPGIFITAAALCVMPLLAWQKRKLARSTGNNALAADAVQSATCAYLALVALAGLAFNAAFHVASADAVAALIATPILIFEGRRALRGQSCGCC
jgi:divalent metal cation (Fe/Co/Zn/Cd) transporter